VFHHPLWQRDICGFLLVFQRFQCSCIEVTPPGLASQHAQVVNLENRKYLLRVVGFVSQKLSRVPLLISHGRQPSLPWLFGDAGTTQEQRGHPLVIRTRVAPPFVTPLKRC